MRRLILGKYNESKVGRKFVEQRKIFSVGGYLEFETNHGSLISTKNRAALDVASLKNFRVF